MKTYNEQARDEAKARLLDGIATLEACKTNDEILAWTYGLGVKIAGNTASAVSLDKATSVDGKTVPVVKNGADEVAQRVRRQDAIAKSIASTRELIAKLETA